VRELAFAFVAFCLLSSATYLVNDVRDRDEDRRHPRKRFRPVAAGELSPRAAVRIAIVLTAAGVIVSAATRTGLVVVAFAYLALTLSYSAWWRQVVVLDIVVVAGGFALRAIAGGAATAIPLSRSFLLVTSACALFLVAGKRYAETAGTSTQVAARRALRRYSPRQLRGVIVGSAALGLLAYARWSFARPQLGLWLPLSLIPFALWLARYTTMLDRGAGEAPEELVLGDPALLTLGVIWGVLFAAGIYVAR
jgi:decaprenyl-phosphate phosphoribosyltransferase